MASFSGRNASNVPLTGYVPRGDVVEFIGRCVLDGWKRVAVGEGYRILAAYQEGGRSWIHPELRGEE